MLPTQTRTSSRTDKVLIVGSSTGGPPALREVLTGIPGDIGVPILVVQHMPAGFTRALAERLDTLCEIEVQEAQPGARLVPGRALVAAGGLHMIIDRNREVRLTMSQPECGVRPSVNVTMESVVRVYGANTVAAILTGMGSDGTRGAGLIKNAGGQVIVEDESTCAVYGMPRSVVAAGLADKVLPLPKIAAELVRAVRLNGAPAEASA